MPYCPLCGTALQPTDVFCMNCGARAAPTFGPVLYAAPTRSPDSRIVWIVVLVVVIGILASVAVSAILYASVSSMMPSPIGTPPPLISATITRSSDGSEWILTVMYASTGLMPDEISLELFAPGGALVLGPVSLSSLSGADQPLAGSLGTLYVQYQGTMAGTLSPGDRLLIGTMTSSGASTAGYQVNLLGAYGTLFSSTLA